MQADSRGLRRLADRSQEDLGWVQTRRNKFLHYIAFCHCGNWNFTDFSGASPGSVRWQQRHGCFHPTLERSMIEFPAQIPGPWLHTNGPEDKPLSSLRQAAAIDECAFNLQQSPGSICVTLQDGCPPPRFHARHERRTYFSKSGWVPACH